MALGFRALLYTIIGTGLATYAEVAERLSRGIGERIEFRAVSPRELRSIVGHIVVVRASTRLNSSVQRIPMIGGVPRLRAIV